MVVERISGPRVAARWRVAAGVVAITVALIAAGCTNPTGPPPGLALADPGLPTAVSYRDVKRVSCVPTGECVAVGNVTVRWDGTRWTVGRAPWYAEPRTSSIDSSPFPALYPYARSADVSCVSARWCMAVAYEGDSTGLGTFIGDGITWRRVPIDANLTPKHVSCTSEQFCLAQDGPTTMRWDGRRWTDLATAAPGDVDSLSCASPTWCLSVGGTFGTPATAARWDGRSWAAEDLGDLGGPVVALRSVSCDAVEHCRAVGRVGEDHSSYALTRTAEGWSAAAVPGGASYLTSIDCATATDCLAVGGRNGPPYGSVLARLTVDGWSVVALPEPQAKMSASIVGCAASTRCVAIGMTHGDDKPDLFTWDGTTVRRNEGDPVLTGPPGSRLTDVSCIEDRAGRAGAYCLAVGYAERGDAPRRVISAAGNGATWQVSVLPQPSDPDQFGGKILELRSVSCLRPRLCFATADELADEPTFRTVRWDGTAWARLEDPVLAGLGGFQVACAGDGCVAAGTSGVAIGTGTGPDLTWRAVTGAGGALAYTDLSCSSTTRCVGLGGAGVVLWDGERTTAGDPALTVPTTLAGDVSCAGDGSCAVLGDDAVLHVDGTVITKQPLPADVFPVAVSCTARNRCTVLANDGRDLLAPPAPILLGWDGRSWARLPARLQLDATWPGDTGLSCLPAWCMHVAGTGGYSWVEDPAPSAPAAQRVPR